MEILIEQHTVPERGAVEFDVHRKFEIRVTAAEAQRQVNQWVLLEVSCVMGALAPSLVIGERVTWRVPVALTAPHVGHVGVAGFIDVDVQTGEMDASPECAMALQASAAALGQKMPSYTPRQDVPVEYLAKHIQPTRQRPIPNRQHTQTVADALHRLAAEE